VNAATFLLAALIVVALWTVQASLMRAALGLGVVSALVTALMFEMDAPLAGVFELSVCAGLITVILVSTVSLTRPLGQKEQELQRTARQRRFHPAILIAILVAAVVSVGSYQPDLAPAAAADGDVREVLWGERRFELIGQMIVLFAGAFAVVVLLRERKKKEARP